MADIVSNAALLVDYPEFNGASSALITAKIAQAARSTNANVYQSTELCNDAVKFAAAILLILSPYGHKMRSDSPEQWLAWQHQLRALQRRATMGLRVF